MNWTCGLSTGIAYRHPIEQVLPVMAAAGFRVIEVSTAPSHVDLSDLPRVRALKDRITDLGLRVHSLHAPFGHDVNLTSPDATQRQQALDRPLGGQLQDFAWILERLPVEGLGVCVDTSHCSLGGFLYDALVSLRSRLVHLQASDNRGHTDDHLPPGEGVIDWAGVRSTLERVGYQGVFMLEVTGDGDLAGHVARLAAVHIAGQAAPARSRS